MRRLVYIVMTAVMLFSCEGGHRIKLPEKYDDVYTAEGRVDDFAPGRESNKFILYVSPAAFKSCVSELALAKMDSIMASNLDWESMIFYHGSLDDTVAIKETFSRFRISSPVIFDPEDSFLTTNGFDEHKWVELSYFLDKRNKVHGMWLIGDGSFERQFNAIKRNIK